MTYKNVQAFEFPRTLSQDKCYKLKRGGRADFKQTFKTHAGIWWLSYQGKKNDKEL